MKCREGHNGMERQLRPKIEEINPAKKFNLKNAQSHSLW